MAVLFMGIAPLGWAQDRSGEQRAGRTPQGRVIGAVVEDETGEPIEGATVAVWQAADSSLVTGTVSKADGSFIIEGLRRGSYYVRISFVGFETQTRSDVRMSSQASHADLGTIRLVTDTEMMDGVEVTAERGFMEVGIDRTVYNTRDQLVSIGGSASDVLQNTPSVEVDIDGSVSLRGSQNVAILINGRPSSMNGEALASFLQGLPADAIERVEVIPNPSARYEPDGMSGIINIVLKKDRDLGLGGSVTASIGTQGSYNASGSLNYQKGRWTLFTNYGFRRGVRDIEGGRFRENRFLDPLTYLEQVDSGDRNSLSHLLNTSLDYRIGAKSTLSATAILSSRGGDNERTNLYRELDADKALTSRYSRASMSDRSDLNMDYRLSFRRTVVPSEHEFTAEIRYEAEQEDDRGTYAQQPVTAEGLPAGTAPERQRTDQDEQDRELSLQVDYMRPFTANGKLEAGYKSSVRQLESDFFSETFDSGIGTFAPDVQLNNTFAFDEQIHAAYGIVEHHRGRIGTQVGVRLEQALTNFDLLTTAETFENNYFSVFPSAFVTYTLSEDASSSRKLKLSYSKRISRPRTRELNPFDDLDDPLFRRVGNPYLNPEYIHAVEASYTQFVRRTSLTLTPYFRRTVDVIRRHETVTPEGISVLTFENFDTRDSWGTELIGTLRLSDWLNTNASFNAYRVVTDGSNVDTDLSNNAFGWTTRLNATVGLRPDLDLQLSYFYRSPIEIEGGRIASFSMSNVALRQKLFGDRANLSLSVRDVFDTMGFQIWREDNNFYQQSSRRWASRQVSLSFTLNFGHKQRKRRDRDWDRQSDDEYGSMEME